MAPMYKLSIVLAVFFIYLHQNIFGQKSDGVVYLNGTLKNFNNQVQLEDMSEMQYLDLQVNDKIIEPDSLNNFSLSFPLKSPQYFRIGRNILYLSPGDSLFMIIDWNRQDSSIFTGLGSDANNYLRFIPFPKAGSYLEAGDNIKETLEQTIIKIKNIADQKIISLKKCVNISTDFKLLEAVRIQADLLNSLIMINTYFPYINKINNDSLATYKKRYQKIVLPLITFYSKKIEINPARLQLGVYRQIVNTLLTQNPKKSSYRNVITDWITAIELVDKFKEINERKKIISFENEIEKINTFKYRQAAINTFNQLMQFRDGDAAIDFTMLDTGKVAIPLSTFNGKIIYVDIWATWCMPCIEELPFIDTLKEKYKNNDEIVFITLSIDSDVLKWEKNLKQRNQYHNQYITERLNLEPYFVTEVPRTIIINKAFKIASMNADLPSSQNTTLILDKLLAQ